MPEERGDVADAVGLPYALPRCKEGPKGNLNYEPKCDNKRAPRTNTPSVSSDVQYLQRARRATSQRILAGQTSRRALPTVLHWRQPRFQRNLVLPCAQPR